MQASTERIAELLAAPDPPLDRLMAVVASSLSEGLTEQAVVDRLDQLAEHIDDGAEVAAVLAHVFGQLGFRGNTTNYYDPRNSLIDHVLERRIGIPLSLAIVASEVARRAGHDLRCVGMPGHVLLGGPVASAEDEWFDPFAGGSRLTRAGCEAIFHALHPDVEFHDAYLEPMNAGTVVARTVENLRVAHLRLGDRSRSVPILQLRADLPGAPPDFRLELANVLASLGRFDAAAEQRDRLVELVPARAEHHRIEALRLRAHRN